MNKFCFLILGVALVASGALAQTTVVLQEDFESVTAPALPAGWTTSTLGTDSGFVAGNAFNVGYVWTVTTHSQFAMSNDDLCNCDKSEDFLISPYVNLSAYADSSVFLSYDMFFDNNFGGVGFIKVSTDSGATWQSVHSIQVREASWVTQYADLSPWAGDTILVAFHYNDLGQWGTGMAIDNVKIFIPDHAVDLMVEKGSYQPDYTIMPLNHVSFITFDMEYNNLGRDTAVQTTLKIEVPEESFSDTLILASVPLLNRSGGTFSQSFSPANTGDLTLRYSTSNAGDPNAANNLVEHTLTISDTVLAYDDGVLQSATSLIEDVVSGQIYTIGADDSLTSVSVNMFLTNATDTISAEVYPCNSQTQIPYDSIIAKSEMILLNQGNGVWYTMGFASPVYLPAGTYFIGIRGHVTSNFNSIANTYHNYKYNRTFSRAEFFGAYFFFNDEAFLGAGKTSTYMIRANFGRNLQTSVPDKIKDADLSVFPNPSTGWVTISSPSIRIKEVLIFNSVGSLVKNQRYNGLKTGTIDLSAMDKGMYMIRIISENGEQNLRKIVLK